ncbi:MAG: hypothetical protein DHS20C17_21010 [Cyclobacteriaceae bacterium]|nr:MAG: hypothetical protein DHS20C17_21010 [Cyclobacteriaceae bacterium]
MKLHTSIKICSTLIACVLVLFTACSDDEPALQPPAITGNGIDVEAGRGVDVTIALSLNAPGGIQSLTATVDGGSPENIPVNTGDLTQNLNYDFSIPAESVLGDQFSLVFTLTDQGNERTTYQATVTTGKLIETPATYEFTRNGASSVSYTGQTERLNMVEEIKAVLTAGDAGGLVSEQVLLDMFANTGDNGGGNFSFSSTKQLKDKTFAPDLDDKLFENLFAGVAAASVNGNNGIDASNGTAGLLTRENSGNTILVDENGREFTQLIEKAMMGAVFYNQMFNLYLTDERTGDDVENVQLADGANHTPMEHGMDEAFGYWDPPLDFTSSWPSERNDEDRFWSHYSNTVDDQLGTNEIIMNAYKEARAAIVNNDLATKNEMREVLYKYHELVAAAVCVHYINGTLSSLNDGKTGEAFHTLSEAWAFANALRYSPIRKITLEQLEQIMETDFGADGNFWNVSQVGLNAAKATLTAVYQELEPVQNDL